MTKIIIAGSRHFKNYGYLSEALNFAFKPLDPKSIKIISGGAKGVDTLAVRYAREHHIDYTIIEAQWNKYGKRAGPKRNGLMAQQGTHLVAFWDGISGGTRDMINQATGYGLKVYTINI